MNLFLTDNYAFARDKLYNGWDEFSFVRDN